jgi:hypothetical protein
MEKSRHAVTNGRKESETGSLPGHDTLNRFWSNHIEREVRMHESNSRLTKIAKRLRQLILACTTEADSGHPTSSLSAVELMAALMFGADTEGRPFFVLIPTSP